MSDQTEMIRKAMKNKINTLEGSREHLQNKYGQVWDTCELQKEFLVESFLAPFVLAKRKSDGVRGTLLFQASPRYYFSFSPE